MDTRRMTVGSADKTFQLLYAAAPMAGEDHTDDNELLIALRHPLRRQILRAMAAQDPISPRQISDELRQPLSNVSYHVRVLADCGAVTLVDTAPVRGSMQHFYSPAIDEPWALAVLGLSGNGEPDPGGEDAEPAA
jgi:DNA-binding transcriptional ArsR family regulator